MRVQPLKVKDPDDPVVRIILAPIEARVLGSLPDQLRQLLEDTDDPHGVVRRLFPDTHLGNPELESEHRALIGKSLMEERLEALNDFEKTLEASLRGSRRSTKIFLDRYEADLWLHVLNDVRLMLGTQLGIETNGWSDEPPEDLHDRARFDLLNALSGIQDALITALMRT